VLWRQSAIAPASALRDNTSSLAPFAESSGIISMLNLLLGIVCLAAAIGLFAHDWVTGEARFVIRGLNISSAWFLLLLAGWNFARWYAGRGRRAEQNALQIAHQARLHRGRRHELPPEPDPSFDFTDKPAAQPPSRNFTDQPPSSN
jgi:hypothetical protein